MNNRGSYWGSISVILLTALPETQLHLSLSFSLARSLDLTLKTFFLLDRSLAHCIWAPLRSTLLSGQLLPGFYTHTQRERDTCFTLKWYASHFCWIDSMFCVCVTQLSGFWLLGSLKNTRLFPTRTTHDGFQFFLQTQTDEVINWPGQRLQGLYFHHFLHYLKKYLKLCFFASNI